MTDRIGDFALTDPITALILGGCVIFLLAAGLAAITAHLASGFEREVYDNRYKVLRKREQKVTQGEFQLKEERREWAGQAEARERELVKRLQERKHQLCSQAHDTHVMAQATLSQMNDETEIDILKWEQL